MVYGILGLINFAHGEIVMIGAMISLAAIQAMTGFALPGPVIVLMGLLIAIPACMLLGYGIERVAYRPLRRAPRLAPLITAIGVSIVLQNIAMIIWGRQYIAFPPAAGGYVYHCRRKHHPLTDLHLPTRNSNHGGADFSGSENPTGAHHASHRAKPRGCRTDGG